MQQHIYTVQIDSKLQDSVRTILKRNVRNVPVVDDQQRLVGLITRANVVDIVYDTIWGDSEDTVQTEHVGKDTASSKVHEQHTTNVKVRDIEMINHDRVHT